jgi:hypothetical protein
MSECFSSSLSRVLQAFGRLLLRTVCAKYVEVLKYAEECLGRIDMRRSKRQCWCILLEGMICRKRSMDK